MKAVKVLVYVMTALLFIGMVALVHGLLFFKKKDSVSGNTVTVSSDVETLIYLGEPAGTEIERSYSSGGLLFMELDGGGKDDRVVAIDVVSGKVVSTVSIGSEPAVEISQP